MKQHNTTTNLPLWAGQISPLAPFGTSNDLQVPSAPSCLLRGLSNRYTQTTAVLRDRTAWDHLAPCWVQLCAQGQHRSDTSEVRYFNNSCQQPEKKTQLKYGEANSWGDPLRRGKEREQPALAQAAPHHTRKSMKRRWLNIRVIASRNTRLNSSPAFYCPSIKCECTDILHSAAGVGSGARWGFLVVSSCLTQHPSLTWRYPGWTPNEIFACPFKSILDFLQTVVPAFLRMECEGIKFIPTV